MDNNRSGVLGQRSGTGRIPGGSIVVFSFSCVVHIIITVLFNLMYRVCNRILTKRMISVPKDQCNMDLATALYKVFECNSIWILAKGGGRAS